MYVIQRHECGRFVRAIMIEAKTGKNSDCTYTKLLQEAKTFSTKESAQAYGKCGNESIVHISDLMVHLV